MSLSWIKFKTFSLVALLLTSLCIASCGGGGGSSPGPEPRPGPSSFTWTGTITCQAPPSTIFAQIKAADGSTNVTVILQLATWGPPTKRYQIKNGQTRSSPTWAK